MCTSRTEDNTPVVACWRRGASVTLALAALLLPTLASSSGASASPIIGGSQAALTAEQAAVWQARALAARLELKLRREAPGAELERRLSRTKYRVLSKTEAIDVVDRVFRLSDRDATPGILRSTAIKRFLSSDVVQVEQPGGGVSVMSSSLPLRSRDAAGTLRSLDFTLESRSDSYRVKQGLVETTVGRKPSAGVTLPDVSFKAVGAADVDGTVVGGSVVFANALDATDFAVTPLALGAEASWFLRSAESPEDLTLHVGVPAGGRLVRGDGGTVSVQDDQGDRVAQMLPVGAVDADGTDVPVELAISGDDLKLHVAHRGLDVRYPIEVDPAFSNYGSRFNGTTGTYNGWTNGYFNSAGSAFTFGVPPGASPLQVNLGTPGNSYAQYSRGLWQFQAPGSAYIFEMDMAGAYHVPGSSNGLALYGLYNASDDLRDLPSVRQWWFDNTASAPRGSGPGSEAVAFSNANRRVCTHNQGVPGGATCPDPGQGGSSNVQPRTLAVMAHVVGRAVTTSFGSGSESTSTSLVSLQFGDEAAPSTPVVSGVPTGWVASLPGSFNVVAAQGGVGLGQTTLAIPGATTQVYTHACAGAGSPATNNYAPCPQQANFAISTPPDAPEGMSTFSVASTSATNKQSQLAQGALKLDKTAPTITSFTGGSIKPNAAVGTEPQTLVVNASDVGAGGATNSGVASAAYSIDGGTPVTKSTTCSSGPCTATFNVPSLALGSHTLRASVTDGVNRSSQESTFTFTVIETTPPVVTSVTGGLHQVPAQGRDLAITATDDASGVARIRVWVLPVADLTVAASPGSATPAGDINVCPSGSACPKTPPAQAFTLSTQTAPGLYQVVVRATDAAGNDSTDRKFPIVVADLRRSTRDRLGLEQYFDYDSTSAGGGSTLSVNGETGNVVWNTTPITLPGRGLSTVVNLTYNSQDRGGALGEYLGRLPVIGLTTAGSIADDAAGFAYGEAGVGFSIGISGPTRVNEPLSGTLVAQTVLEGTSGLVPAGTVLPAKNSLKIGLTDADGTRHVFSYSEDHWVAPAGTHLRLRRYRSGGSAASVLADKWAMTSPEGLTYFYDNLGFLTSAQDRNSNVLTYNYAKVNLLGTAAVCQPSDALGSFLTATTGNRVCAMRLQSVTDAAGRTTVTLDYKPDTGTGASASIGALASDLLPAFPSTLPAVPFTRAGRISRLTDKLNDRAYDLQYDDDGYLTQLTEASNAPEKRVTRFEYQAFNSSLHVGQDRTMVAVKAVRTDTDSEVSRTALCYSSPCPSTQTAPSSSGTGSPQTALRLTERDGSPTEFGYQPPAGQTPRRFVVSEQAQAATSSNSARVLVTSHEIDSSGRPTAIVDPKNVRTTLAWDDQQNAIHEQRLAAGTSDERRTLTDYDAKTGVVTDTTEFPKWPSTADQRLTHREYRFSDGTLTAGDGDVGSAYVADLTTLAPPRSSTRLTYGLDARGNVTSETDTRGYQRQVGYDALGQVTSTTDENQDVTTYDEFTPAGMPKVVRRPVEPGDGPDERKWSYTYDGSGNVRTATDPRGRDSTATPRPYTTSSIFDAFDRLTVSTTPKKSESPGADTAFVTRMFKYDRDDHLTLSVDALGEATRVDYTPVGKPARIVEPGAPASRTTAMVYDDAARLTARIDPLGDPSDALVAQLRDEQTGECETGNATARAHVTRWCLDGADNPVAQIVYGPGDESVRHVTATAFDGRHNAVGEVDAERTKTLTVPAAIAAAGDPQKQRTGSTYDKLDELTIVDQRAAASETGTFSTRVLLDYDENGNRISTSDPRDQKWTSKVMYDHRDRPIAAIDQLGRETCTVRRRDGLPIAQTTPRGTATDKDACLVAGFDNSPYTHNTTTYDYNRVGEMISRSVPFVAEQYGLSDAQLRTWRTTWKRNAVGDPETITDARAAAAFAPGQVPPERKITNTFLDTGQLASTTRPGWWQADWGDSSPVPQGGRAYPTTGIDADTQVMTGGPRILENDGTTRNAAKSGQAGRLPSSEGAGDMGDVAAQPMTDLLPAAGAATFGYDDEGRLQSVTDALGHVRRIEYFADGSVKAKQWPAGSNSSIRHEFSYDRDGNLTDSTIKDETYATGSGATTTAPADLVTSFGYDAYDRATSITEPGSRRTASDTTLPAEVSQLRYDDNDRLHTWQTALGADAKTTLDYDSFDRLVRETNAHGDQHNYGYDRADQLLRDRTPRSPGVGDPLFETTYGYDPAGQRNAQTQNVLDGATQQVLQTTYAHDDDGNLTGVLAPGAAPSPTGTGALRRTTTVYDGRGLPWKRTEGSNAEARTIATEYDPNGNLRRTVDGLGWDQDADHAVAPYPSNDEPAGLDAASKQATVMVYDNDDLLNRERMPWDDSDSRKFRRAFKRDGVGRVESIVSPYTDQENYAPRTSYTYTDGDWIASQTDAKTSPAQGQAPLTGQTITYRYDKRGNQISLETDKYQSGQGGRRMERSYFPDGTLARRVGKQKNASSEDETQSTRRTYDYVYDANRALTGYRQTTSGSGGTVGRVTAITRDPLGRQLVVDEQGAGGRDTEVSYDAAGNVALRRTDGIYDSQAGTMGGSELRTTMFTYDSLDREVGMRVASASGAPDRVSSTRFWPSGDRMRRTKPNGVVDEWGWSSRGDIAQHSWTPTNASAKVRDYDYDLDGNRTRDERGTYEYNIRDQVTKWTRGASAAAKPGGISYALRGDGAVTRAVEFGASGQTLATTDFDFTGEGERLSRQTTTPATGPAIELSFDYDEMGSVSRIGPDTGVNSGRSPASEVCTSSTPGEVATQASNLNQTYYCYDEFERSKFFKGAGPAAGQSSSDDDDPTTVTYDALDRRDSSVSVHADPFGGSSSTQVARTFNYVGTSEALSREVDAGAQTRDRAFDYDSQGERQGMYGGQAGSPAKYWSYRQDAQGSVTGLEDPATGAVTSADEFVYDPYGQPTDMTPSGQNPAPASSESRLNPFGFQGFFQDNGTRTYDMQARSYRPDTTRFTSQDAFEDAAGDQALQASPLTQNRYTFGAGNPTTNTEFDGHKIAGPGPSKEAGGSNDSPDFQSKVTAGGGAVNGRGRPPRATRRRAYRDEQARTFQHAAGVASNPKPGNNPEAQARPRPKANLLRFAMGALGFSGRSQDVTESGLDGFRCSLVNGLAAIGGNSGCQEQPRSLSAYTAGSRASLATQVLVPTPLGKARAAGLAAKGLTDGERIGIVRDAFQRNGNYGLGSATAREAGELGMDFIGPGFTRSRRDPNILVSKDGLRQYRPPSYKPKLGRTQANFQRRFEPGGMFNGNGHLDIYP